jgi:predicted dithiol-disulfide oxidoreductase (DUF899 family)
MTKPSEDRPAGGKALEHLAFPGESPAYRAARNELLAEEMELRRQIERVSARRRALPKGGLVKEDYVFEGLLADEKPGPVKLSELFADKSTVALYSFMYGLDRKRPCPGCTHFLDSFDGVLRHASQTKHLEVFVVAKSPLARILAFARERGWNHLRFLSTASNDYDKDYYGDSLGLADAMRSQQDFKPGTEWDMPMMNVFQRDRGEVRHFWGSEMLYVPPEPGQDYRHNDLLDPLWNLLDLTPEGRAGFEPKVSY